MKISAQKNPIAEAFDFLKAIIVRRPELFVCMCLVLLIGAVFGQTLHHDFINCDDPDYVTDNPAVLGGLNFGNLKWAFTHFVSANWHPLTILSHMLDSQIYGGNAGGHHLTNVIFHALATILLFLVLREMTGALWRSAFVAAVFAIHPLRVESVAWVAERKDVLSGVFFMLILWTYTRYTRHPFSWGRYLLVLGLFALGLMSKPMLVTMPFLLLLLDFWPLGRFADTTHQLKLSSALKRLVIEKIPFIVLSAGSCIVTMRAQRVTMSGEGVTLQLRLGNAFLSYVTYIKQLFLPTNLGLMYAFHKEDVQLWKCIAAFLLIAFVTVAVFTFRRKHPFLLVGWFWYLGLLVPVLGLVQVGIQAHADRYTYLPQIGLYILFVWTVAELFGLARRTTLAGSLAVLIVGTLAVCAYRQASYWTDSESIWRRTLAVTSNNPTAEYNLGSAYYNQGRIDDALVCFDKASKLDPQNPLVLNGLGAIAHQKGDVDQAISYFRKSLATNPDNPQTLANLGGSLLEKGDVAEAMTYLQKALALRPDAATYFKLGVAYSHEGKPEEAAVNFQKALELAPNEPAILSSLATMLMQTGKIEDAIPLFEKSLAAMPNDPEAEANLGLALFNLGKLDEAIVHWERALKLQPDNAQVQNNLGNALMATRRPAEAATHFEKALQLRPHYIEAESNLAWILATSAASALRNGTKAVELAEDANQLTEGKNPMILRILAAAYAEAGRFELAAQTGKQALQLTTNPAQANALTNEINLYLNNTPFHDPAATQ